MPKTATKNKIVPSEETIDAEPVGDDNEPLAPLPTTPRLKSARAPVGIKTTERHTVERYSEPVPSTVETDEEFTDESEEAPPFFPATGKIADEMETPSLSAVDQLLGSLKDSSECVIYVQRRQDPPGFEFRTPAPQNVSMGPLAWDASFNCKEAIDTALQFAFGGGKYQLQLRVDNETRKQWTTIVADPPMRNNSRQDHNGGMTVSQPLSGAATFKDQLKDVTDIIKILNPRGIHETPQVDPASAIQQQFAMIGTVMATVKDFLPEPPAPVAPVKGGSFLETLAVNAFQFFGTPAGQQMVGGAMQGLGRMFARPTMPATGPTAQVVAQPMPNPTPPVPHAAPDLNDPHVRAQAISFATDRIMVMAIDGIKFDKHPGWMVQGVQDTIHQLPELAGDIGMLMNMPNAQILSILTERAGEDVSLYPSAEGWLDDVRAEILELPMFLGTGDGDGGGPAGSGLTHDGPAVPQFEMNLHAAGVGDGEQGVGDGEDAIDITDGDGSAVE